MSEEAGRQTRSQKRALERDVTCAESSNIDNESKRPKLDSLEATPQTQTKNNSEPWNDRAEAQDSHTKPRGDRAEAQDSYTKPRDDRAEAQDSHTKPRDDRIEAQDSHTEPQANCAEPRDGCAELDMEQKEEQSRTSLSLLLPLAHSGKKEHPQRQINEASSDNRTESKDTPCNERTEVTGIQTRVRQMEPKAIGGMLAAGEVEATIKVEVQAADQPVDMTTSKGLKKEKRPPSPEDDDVIILSDNDSPSPPMNGLSHLKELNTDLLMKSSPEEREHIIKQLKEELRLEEAKLVLLKKLRQSQIQKDTIQKSSAPPPLIRGPMTGSKGSQQILTGRNSGTVIPPPLVRGGQQTSSKHSSQVIMPPLVRGAQQIQALRQQQQQQLSAGNSGSGPPPLLLGPRTSAPASHNQRGVVQSGLIRGGGNTSVLASSSLKGSTSGSGLSVISVNDSPASRQAAAKLALRKQLEKTLLEIPPPKPPAPEFNFLPSAANNEFIYLVGLEEVVQNLLDTFHKGKTSFRPIVRDPFICTQCKTDFTCRWRLDKVKGGLVFCEDCMSSNQKKAFKTEHTNRLKAAFVKALQQEQEIDQCNIQASPTLSHSNSSLSSSLKTGHLASQQLKQAQARASSLQHHHQASRTANLVQHHSIKQSSHSQLSHGSVSSSSVRRIPHSFSSSSHLQSAVAAAALVSRPGKSSQASRPSVQSTKVHSSGISGGKNFSGGSASSTAWKKQSNRQTGVTMAYVNPSLTGHKTSASVDARQREYLLDMIPSRSSISQTANTWK
uniref:Transcriptional repressor p66 coiled-coil MBD2-interaction domain-containing protein n=1 Tax=Neogobius melanostomus TaxID=47308 RepID=A0A8C6TWC2_9GOBI